MQNTQQRQIDTMCIDAMPAAQAVEALIFDYGRLVFQVIYGLTGEWHESQDLTQDTFLRALRAIDAARRASGAHFHAKAWLLQIAVNTVRMQRRRRSIIHIVPFSSLHEEQPEEHKNEFVGERLPPIQPAGYGTQVEQDPADVIVERDAIGRTIAQLPETLRLCLLLSVVGGLSSREIARSLDLSEVAVRQRLSRAKKLFQQLYLQGSGETLIERSTVTSQVETRGQPVTVTATSLQARSTLPL
ncbi:MAG TPA: RNA polymerase sigma factor [Ktedonobacteraceae bacterium]|nr:RNA polymerase sigma factor [Ktedonobacteraceae bacterium]